MVEKDRTSDADPIEAAAHFLVVESPFYPEIGAMLLAGAGAALAAGRATFDVVRVPGALEIPVALGICFDAGGRRRYRYAGAVALGCVIRGETYHFEVVANESARGLMQFGTATGVPVGNGILTVENKAQAIRRADPAQGNKGGEAARAAMTLWRLKQGVEAR